MDQFLLCEGLLSKLNVFDNIPVVLEKVDDRFIQASLFGEILSNWDYTTHYIFLSWLSSSPQTKRSSFRILLHMRKARPRNVLQLSTSIAGGYTNTELRRLLLVVYAEFSR